MKFLSILILAAFLIACGPNQRIIESGRQNRENAEASINSAAPAQPPTFGEDLESMHTADFKFVYVIRRKDGAVMDADDKRYLSATIPSEMNRRRLSDEGKAVLVGSNFRMPEESLELFTDRFLVEDHSKVVLPKR